MRGTLGLPGARDPEILEGMYSFIYFELQGWQTSIQPNGMRSPGHRSLQTLATPGPIPPSHSWRSLPYSQTLLKSIICLIFCKLEVLA